MSSIIRTGIAAVVVALLAAALPAAAGDRVPLPELARGKGEHCGEPTPDIRRNHMRYLMHQRDDTVHQGIRGARHSLKECIECHAGQDASGAYLPVNAPGQFCQSCHSYAAVRMDCFECHATKPEAGRATARLGAPGDARLLDDMQRHALTGSEERSP